MKLINTLLIKMIIFPIIEHIFHMKKKTILFKDFKL